MKTVTILFVLLCSFGVNAAENCEWVIDDIHGWHWECKN